MTDDASTLLTTCALTTAEMAREGVSRRDLRRLVDAGILLRLRNGRYVPADTTAELVRAGRLGGRVDCLSLLVLLGVFVADCTTLHLQFEPGTTRLPARPPQVRAHWRPCAVPREALTSDIVSALAQACRCQGPREAVASLESAWYLGVVDEAGITEVFASLPLRFRRLRPLLDPRSESGTESLMRLILRTLGADIQVQVSIPGVGRVDFVVDGWLIVECDSRAHHEGWDAQRRDRRRDLAAAELGYTTVRPLAEDILFHRDAVLRSFGAILSHGGVRRP